MARAIKPQAMRGKKSHKYLSGAAALSLVAMGVGAAATTPAQAAVLAPVSPVIFTHSSSVPATFTVPAGVSKVSALVTGAAGGTTGNGNNEGGIGGSGGSVVGTILVTPGQTFTVQGSTRGSNGQAGGNPGAGGAGYGNGGNGGNMKKLVANPGAGSGGGGSSALLDSAGTPLIVAGGGGGGGGGGGAVVSCDGGDGGAGGKPAASGTAGEKSGCVSRGQGGNTSTSGKSGGTGGTPGTATAAGGGGGGGGYLMSGTGGRSGGNSTSGSGGGGGGGTSFAAGSVIGSTFSTALAGAGSVTLSYYYNTQITITPSTASPVLNQVVSYSATVNASGTSAPLSGSIKITGGPCSDAAAPVLYDGVTPIPAQAIPTSTTARTVCATFPAQGAYEASQQELVLQNVKANSTVTIDPLTGVQAGDSPTVGAGLSSDNGVVPMTGTIQFALNGVNVGGPVSVSARGVGATVDLPSLAEGSYVLTATYSGDANYVTGLGVSNFSIAPAPTEEPSTVAPTEDPTTAAPTEVPTTEVPTEEPPTETPATEVPSEIPTEEPSVAPSDESSNEPSLESTQASETQSSAGQSTNAPVPTDSVAPVTSGTATSQSAQNDLARTGSSNTGLIVISVTVLGLGAGLVLAGRRRASAKH